MSRVERAVPGGECLEPRRRFMDGLSAIGVKWRGF
jgi:hypothetical protein